MSKKIPRPLKPEATAVSSTQIDLSWSRAENAIAYLIERRQPNATKDNFIEIATVPATNCYYADTKLFLAEVYHYRLRATYATGGLSPYSLIAKAKTYAGPPPLRKWWNDVQAKIAKCGSPDLDTLCELKAIEAAKDMRGWDCDCSLAIGGYIAAKEALPDFLPERGELGGYLYAVAKGAMTEAVRDERYIQATGFKRQHNSHEQRAKERKTKPWLLGRPVFLDDDKDLNAVRIGETLAASDGENEKNMTIENIFSPLSTGDRCLIELQLKGVTVPELARLEGISKTTVDRRLKEIREKVLTAAQSV